MTDVLDPSYAYILLFLLIAVSGTVIGYTSSGSLGIFGSAILAGILGFVSGLYTSREETDIFGSLLLSGGFTALVIWFLPLGVTWGVAIFLIGFIIGMRTERR